MPQRWFVAIPLDDAHKDVFAAFRKQNASAFRELPQPKKVRWMPLNNLHITGLFIGDVDEAEQGAVKKAIRQAVEATTAFQLHFERFAFAPENRKPRMIWARFQKSDAFAALHHALREAVGSVIELEAPPKELIPHTTLARFKPFRNKDGIQLRQTGAANLSLAVDRCELWVSELQPDGAKYAVVEEFPLTGKK